MKNLRISMKLIASFSIVLALTLLVGVVGIIGLTQMSAAADTMYTERSKPLGNLASAMEYFQRVRVQTRNAIIYSGNADQLRTVETDLTDRLNNFEAQMDIYAPTILTQEGKDAAAVIVDQQDRVMRPGVLHILDQAKQGASTETLLESLAVTVEAADIIAANMTKLSQLRMDVMASAATDNTNLGNMLLIVIIGVIVVAIIIGFILAFYISGLISKPLIVLSNFMKKAGTTGDLTLSQEDVAAIGLYGKLRDETGQTIGNSAAFVNHIIHVSDALSIIANGDLTPDIKLLSEQDMMGLSLTKMLDSLNNMFGEIHNSTNQVSTGAKQIADGSQALAQGSTEQAASVEQLSSSISEIAEKTRTNADMAGKAANLANTIMRNAEKGSQQMNELTGAVRDINTASQNISKVIKSIEDIAFQTNILALNASVEAARAGQHGKGFAVVAEEVRNLATKSSEAAKDTGALIANSVEKAELGARIADETASSLTEIVAGINESSQLVGEIAKSSEEQSLGIAQINKGIDQVAQVVQQNSATAEESAAASEEMSGQSIMLEELIAQFKLREEHNA
ncbi:MAG: methyl-accepting chemotaxis protein, partial [Oscillospiraceae bacterium]|nr:methyl-accepting chemotaxis protein [Oscillospiraceae bacterium]